MTSGIAGDGAERALRQQVSALDGVADRLAHARVLLPPAGGGGVWSGDARRMYVLALQQLSTQVLSAGAHIDDAIRDTRAALATLASPGGAPHGR
ncbi:hypothetical protein ACVXZ4_18200 [Lacisediminihabitans sp. FW035]